tara:strand:- start:31440 stop:32093 length:654 start_codon:yes stop_codon:yes gene_type:complete
MALVQNSDFPNFFEVSHPLISSKLALLRNSQTEYKLFRELVHEITLLIAYEATHNLKTHVETIQTPMETSKEQVLDGPAPVILPILRAGIGMVEAMLSLMPSAKVGHIGLFRNEETLEPEAYYFKVPKANPERPYYVVDPMMATGGSAIRAVDTLKENNVKDITMLCLLAVPEGLQNFFAQHADVAVYSASLDRELDKNGFIRPGLGDAGDRMFGTF